MWPDRPRVLITGAGGPAAVAAIRTLRDRAEVFAVDIDPLAVGLYLVGDDRRALVPRGDDADFGERLLELAIAWRIDVVIPTVDGELVQLARQRNRFGERDVRVMVADEAALVSTLDKYKLSRALDGNDVPRTMLVHPRFASNAWTVAGEHWPAIAKPRFGSGGRGVCTVNGQADMATVPRDGSFVLQQLLPGDEMSVDMLVRRSGRVVAAVPRTRLKVDSGIAVAGQTVHDACAVEVATRVVTAMSLVGPLNVQLRRDEHDRWRLLEVNPRLPGCSPLTAAAGVDLVGLALADLLGETLHDWYEFDEVAMVRHWEDVVIPAGEFGRTRRSHDAALAGATT